MIDEKKEFLKPSYYCDFNNEKIIRFVKKNTQNITTKEEKVIYLFNYIKDNFKYSFGDWNLKASEVIDKKIGMCTTKSNLLVACLRSLNIPAGFVIMRINARDIFEKFTKINFLKNRISTNSIHMYVKLFLNNKWISIDPSLDNSLLRGLINFGYYKSSLDKWDGKSDYINFISPEYIIKDLGLFSNINEYHERKRNTANNIFIFFSNLIMNYYRFLGRITQNK